MDENPSCFSTLLDIDELIQTVDDAIKQFSFSTLLNIEKDTLTGVFFVDYLLFTSLSLPAANRQIL